MQQTGLQYLTCTRSPQRWGLSPKTQRSVLSEREKDFHGWQWRRRLSHSEASARSALHGAASSGGPAPMGAATATSGHPTAVLTLTLHRLRYDLGARAASLQTTGHLLEQGAHTACICCLLRKPSQPLANEMSQSCPPNPR